MAAAAALVEEGGPAAVTARAVAARAGLPLASVSYHVQDVATLLREAVAELLESLEAGVEQRSHLPLPPPGEDEEGLVVAGAVVDLVLGPYADRGVAGVQAMYARVLELATDEVAAPRLRRYDQACARGVARLLRSAGRRDDQGRAVLALADGWMVAAALAGPEVGHEALTPWVVARLAPGLLALAPAVAGPAVEQGWASDR